MARQRWHESDRYYTQDTCTAHNPMGVTVFDLALAEAIGWEPKVGEYAPNVYIITGGKREVERRN